MNLHFRIYFKSTYSLKYNIFYEVSYELVPPRSEKKIILEISSERNRLYLKERNLFFPANDVKDRDKIEIIRGLENLLVID